MHLAESLALAAGAKLTNQKIYEKFTPLGVDKFISFHKILYENHQEVINILKPILSQYDIEIIQIGGANYKNIKGISNVKEYCHATYILRKSLLHYGEYSILFDLAASVDIKRVILNSISDPKFISPYLGDKNKEIILNNYTKEGSLPFYDPNATKDLVNKIKPEDIAEKVCEGLGIPYTKPYSTIHIGKNYKENFYEVNVYPVKDYTYNLPNIPEPIIRLDFCYDLQFLENHIRSRKYRIRTDREIPEQFLARYKDNIAGIDLEIKNPENFDVFIKNIKKYKINLLLFSFNDESKSGDMKLKYLDIEPINFQKIEKCQIDLAEENLYFKCDELICYKNNYYITKDDIINNNKYDPNRFNRVKDFNLDDSIDNCLFVKSLTN